MKNEKKYYFAFFYAMKSNSFEKIDVFIDNYIFIFKKLYVFKSCVFMFLKIAYFKNHVEFAKC